MNPVFKKLNYKDQPELYIINAPDSFLSHQEEMRHNCIIHSQLDGKPVSFLLIFITTSQEIKNYTPRLKDILKEDPVIWFAYPKKSSNKFTSDVSRDFGWQPLGKLGFEPVRQVAIDEDWSALRFRNPAYMKSLKRDPSRMISRQVLNKI